MFNRQEAREYLASLALGGRDLTRALGIELCCAHGSFDGFAGLLLISGKRYYGPVEVYDIT